MTISSWGGFKHAPFRVQTFQDLVDFGGAMRIRMLRENPAPRGLSDASRAIGCETLQMSGDFRAVARDQNLAIRFEEALDTLPIVGDDASARAGGFENA